MPLLRSQRIWGPSKFWFHAVIDLISLSTKEQLQRTEISLIQLLACHESLFCGIQSLDYSECINEEPCMQSPGSFQEASATLGVAARSRQMHSRQLWNEDQEMDLGEKLDVESKLRSWRESRAKTPGKIAPSPLRPYTPGHARSCPPSPSVKSAKRTLAADLDISSSRSR